MIPDTYSPLPKKICVFTGTRAEYGLLKPVMNAIAAHPALKLQVIAGGMHLEAKFGMTVNRIREDGFIVDAEVPMHPPEDTGKGMALAVSEGIRGMSDALSLLKPDVLVVLGDRTEVLASAIAAMYAGILIAHIHGGDVSKGGLDESVRHAVTRMAHLHFPATPKSAERIRMMGEEEFRIHLAGAPALDTILAFEPLSDAELESRYGIPPNMDFFLLVQHSVSTQPEEAGSQIETTFEALDQCGKPVVALYPNSDAGSTSIIAALEKRKGKKDFYLFDCLPQEVYLSLMKRSLALVGNSSSGMIESSSFHIPVVDIGMRQEGRECAGNVIRVAHDPAQILTALRRCLEPEFRQSLLSVKNPYGGGTTGKDIAEILANLQAGPALLQKHLTYPL